MALQIIHSISLLFFLYLGLISLYFFLLAVGGKLRKTPVYAAHPVKKTIAILIPAYRENEIIVETVRAATGHDYPKVKFRVFVGADHLNTETLTTLSKLGAEVLVLNFENSTKARSLNALLNHIAEQEFEIAIILDADNIMSAGALEKINSAFHQGFEAVQLKRIAKNQQNDIALFDGISEAINNHLYRRGHRALGLSAHTIGSGMAFRFSKLKQIYNKPGILDNPACDREVDFEISRDGKKIEFIETAFVFDEKVSNLKVFERQRTRWMESQLVHIRLYLQSRGMQKTIDYWNKFLSLFIPPRILLLATGPCLLLIHLLSRWLELPSPFYPSVCWFTVVYLVYLLSLLIALPTRYLKVSTLRALGILFPLLFTYIRAIIQIKPGRKEFMHTPKSVRKDQKK